MRLHILGCYAATPRTLSNPTSQVLEVRNRLFLIDCAEGTQVQLRKNKIKFSKIDHIFISHLHGDHFFGLPGLISTFRLLGRKNALHIYGPKGIKEAMELLMRLGDSWIDYPLHFYELTSKEQQTVFEDDAITVKTLPLDHRVYTNGFLFQEKPEPRKLDIVAAEKFGVDRSQFQNVKNGKDVVLENGQLVSNKLLTLDPPKPLTYAYCSDTAYKEDLIPLVSGADVLYHEATFMDSEEQFAGKTKHSTAKQAARVAKAAKVGQLILGHYSTRYKSLEGFKAEAETIFDQVELADDGRVFDILPAR